MSQNFYYHIVEKPKRLPAELERIIKEGVNKEAWKNRAVVEALWVLASGEEKAQYEKLLNDLDHELMGEWK